MIIIVLPMQTRWSSPYSAKQYISRLNAQLYKNSHFLEKSLNSKKKKLSFLSKVIKKLWLITNPRHTRWAFFIQNYQCVCTVFWKLKTFWLFSKDKKTGIFYSTQPKLWKRESLTIKKMYPGTSPKLVAPYIWLLKIVYAIHFITVEKSKIYWQEVKSIALV